MNKEDFIKLMQSLKIDKYYYQEALNGTSKLHCIECYKNNIESQVGLTRVEVEGAKLDVIRCTNDINHLKSIPQYTNEFLTDYRIRFNGMKDLITCDNTKILNFGCTVPSN